MRSATKDQIRKDREVRQNPYAHLNGDGELEALAPEAHPAPHQPMGTPDPNDPIPIPIDPHAIINRRRRSYRDSDIEKAAAALQQELWRHRHAIYAGYELTDPLALLDPSIAIRCLGFTFYDRDSLGQFSDTNGRFEVAGQIDRHSDRITISSQFPPHVRNFTAAHELGHAILHDGATLHRDRALDGSWANVSGNRKEVEANKFAAAFLMPEKQMRHRFHRAFGLDKLVLDDDSAFALTSQTQDELRATVRTVRAFARMVAGASFYHGQHFAPLAEQFRVSVKTMAIRLEEMDLVAI